jgi:hypothetical protein
MTVMWRMWSLWCDDCGVMTVMWMWWPVIRDGCDDCDVMTVTWWLWCDDCDVMTAMWWLWWLWWLWCDDCDVMTLMWWLWCDDYDSMTVMRWMWVGTVICVAMKWWVRWEREALSSHLQIFNQDRVWILSLLRFLSDQAGDRHFFFNLLSYASGTSSSSATASNPKQMGGQKLIFEFFNDLKTLFNSLSFHRASLYALMAGQGIPRIPVIIWTVTRKC